MDQGACSGRPGCVKADTQGAIDPARRVLVVKSGHLPVDAQVIELTGVRRDQNTGWRTGEDDLLQGCFGFAVGIGGKVMCPRCSPDL